MGVCPVDCTYCVIRSPPKCVNSPTGIELQAKLKNDVQYPVQCYCTQYTAVEMPSAVLWRAQCSAAQCSAGQCSAVQHCPVFYCPVLPSVLLPSQLGVHFPDCTSVGRSYQFHQYISSTGRRSPFKHRCKGLKMKKDPK